MTGARQEFSVLITCPPMLRSLARYREHLHGLGIVPVSPEITQVMSEEQLIAELPKYAGWIIGDDPATAVVFKAGVAGNLRAAVKWGVGVDNVDFDGARAVGLDVTNTPGMFSDEVADLAMCFVTGLAREAFSLSAGVRAGGWPKPVGMSLKGKVVALLGYGNIGRETADRLLAAKMCVNVYDPYIQNQAGMRPELQCKQWPEGIADADFLVLTCSLNRSTRHIINAQLLSQCKPGVRVVNVSRGALIDEVALVGALQSGQVSAAALEVFETEPLPQSSNLRNFANCIFGSHNGSNTQEAVDRTSAVAINLLYERLRRSHGAI